MRKSVLFNLARVSRNIWYVFRWKSTLGLCFLFFIQELGYFFFFLYYWVGGLPHMHLALFRFLWLLDGVPDLHLFFMSGKTESSTQITPQSLNCEWWAIAHRLPEGEAARLGVFCSIPSCAGLGRKLPYWNTAALTTAIFFSLHLQRALQLLD